MATTQSDKVYTIRIDVIRAVNLRAADVGGTSDPYVVVGWADSPRDQRKKTKIIKKDLNPTWGETVYLVHNSKHQTKIEFTVWDHDLIGKDDFLGYAEVDLLRAIQENNKEIELVLGVPKTTRKLKDKVKGSLFVRFVFPSSIVNNVNEIQRLKKVSKLGEEMLIKLWEEFKKLAGRSDTLRSKQQIVQLAKNIGFPLLLQSLLGEEKLDDELQKRLENDPTHEDLLYENLMSIFDINKDGELSLHELVIGMGILSKGTRAEKAELLFNLYDKDGNGVLDAEELKQLQKSYCKASKAAFMVGFRYGAEKKLTSPPHNLSKDEFERLMTEVADIFDGKEWADIVFKLTWQRQDANKDGTITKDEYIAWFCDEEGRKKLREEIDKALKPLLAKKTKQIQEIAQKYLHKAI